MTNKRSDLFRKKRRNRRILYVFIGVFLILYALFWQAFLNINDTADTVYNSISTNKKRESDIAIEATQPISFAFLGVDKFESTDEDVPGRSDAILIGTVNPKTRTTTLVSIPRDTYALMDGYETYDGSLFYDKITHAYAFGEAEMAINSIQELVDIPIDYYVEVNMTGLVDIVDALDGIEVTSPLTFDYHEDYFIEGETRVLTGEEALNFARMRKTDPEGDFGRQKREKIVVKAIMDKTLSLGTLANYETILKSVEDNVKTNLTLRNMTDIFSSYSKSLENFEQGSLYGEELWLDDIYYFYVQPEERLTLSNQLRKELELDPIEMEDLHLSDTDYYNLEYAEYNDFGY